MSSLDTVHRSFRPRMVAIAWSLLLGFGFADSLEFLGTAVGQEPASTISASAVSASADSAEAQKREPPITFAREPITFAREIVRVLTKHGCNSSDCHGGVKGRGGFKLSLDAIDPREDYRWIVRGGGYQVLSEKPLIPIRPRIHLKAPKQSLLLLKPTETQPHEGGLRFATNSPDYLKILNWVRHGAPYGGKGKRPGIRVERIEVFPREAVLPVSGNRQILVTAHLSDGRREDFTDQVRFESLQPQIAGVTAKGVVEAKQSGVATVLIRAVGHIAQAQFRVIERPIHDYSKVPRTNFIDEQVFAKLQTFRIVPSELSGDSEFLRRVCLDLTGTLPPPERVREFLDSQDPDKRDKLIELLLDSPEFVEFWTFRFADLFRVAGAYGWVHQSWEWVRKSIARNKPYDQMAREIIAAQGYNGPSRVYLLRDNKPVVMERVVAEQFRVFMGRRLDCAQCHNHPFDRWSQNQFWGLAAFYGRMTNTQWYGDNVVFDDPQGHEVNFGEKGESLTFRQAIHPRTKQLVVPRFPDGRALAEADRDDPRRALAKWMTSHPYFSEATVNRMWGNFFGRGLVDPVDDFRLANPPTHPKLLELLAKDFEKSGYNLKHLFRRIVRSRTYQLSSTTHETNRGDVANYSHALPRPLEAEVLLDAISSVTGVSEDFEVEGGNAGKAPPGTRAINLKRPASYSSRFLEVYGRPLRYVVPERDGQANLSQALHMLVGATYTEKLTKPGGRISRLLKSEATHREVIEELYLATLARFPTESELADLQTLIRKQPSRPQAMANLLWALICSREFADNH